MIPSRLQEQHVRCHDENAGRITGVVSGGISPYIVTIEEEGIVLQIEEAGTFEVNELDQGSYTVQLQDANGCSLEMPAEIMSPDPLEVVVETVGTTAEFLSNGSITLAISGGTAPYDIQWSNGMTTASIDNLRTGMYSFTIQDANGCTYVDHVMVSVQDFAQNFRPSNALSPNGDGINDTWQIDDIERFSSSEVIVMNARGQVVYRQSNYQNDWDGSFRGSKIVAGTYFYRVILDQAIKYDGYLEVRY